MQEGFFIKKSFSGFLVKFDTHTIAHLVPFAKKKLNYLPCVGGDHR